MTIRRLLKGSWSLLQVGIVIWLALSANRLSARDESIPLPPPLVAGGAVEVAELLKQAQPLLPKGAYLGPLLDDHYTVIDHAWLERRFLPAFQRALEFMKARGSRTAQSADCDNYAMFLRQMVGLAAMLAGSDEPAVAQVVVFQAKPFGGVKATQERHNLCLFLTERGWFVVEPQAADRLTPIERYSNRNRIQFITFH